MEDGGLFIETEYEWMYWIFPICSPFLHISRRCTMFEVWCEEWLKLVNDQNCMKEMMNLLTLKDFIFCKSAKYSQTWHYFMNLLYNFTCNTYFSFSEIYRTRWLFWLHKAIDDNSSSFILLSCPSSTAWQFSGSLSFLLQAIFQSSFSFYISFEVFFLEITSHFWYILNHCNIMLYSRDLSMMTRLSKW